MVSSIGPRPGRILAARSHQLSQLADAIDTAFARWDRSHLYKFELGDGRLIGQTVFDDFDLGIITTAPWRCCRHWHWVSNSSMSSISVPAGPICARWSRHGLTRSRSWGSCLAPRIRTAGWVKIRDARRVRVDSAPVPQTAATFGFSRGWQRQSPRSSRSGCTHYRWSGP